MDAALVVSPDQGSRAAVAPGAASTAPLRPARASAAAVVGVMAAVLVLVQGPVAPWGVACASTAALLVWLAAIDLESRVVPNRIVLPAIATLVAIAFVLDPLHGVEHVLAAGAAGAFLLLAALARPGSLGMGDVKLGALLGALLGGGVLDALTIGFVLVGAVGLVLVVRHGRGALRRHLPLAPFLAAGAIASLLVG